MSDLKRRNTWQKDAVRHALGEAIGFVGAQQLHLVLRNHGSTIGLALVKALVEERAGRIKEAALTLSRTLRVRKERVELWSPADCIGECGAMIGTALLVLWLARRLWTSISARHPSKITCPFYWRYWASGIQISWVPTPPPSCRTTNHCVICPAICNSWKWNPMARP